jgi:hypothetical protein
VEGQEATRNGLIVWDGLGLKGSCHIWIDGENDGTSANATGFEMWEGTEAPTAAGKVYYFLNDCTLTGGKKAQAGQMWKLDGENWVEFEGDVFA